jgi:hypothetical protein
MQTIPLQEREKMHTFISFIPSLSKRVQYMGASCFVNGAKAYGIPHTGMWSRDGHEFTVTLENLEM